jgi:hypothetical protein
MQKVSEAYPQLWHYTTASGLLGIVSSQELWATSIFYLNDAQEYEGFFEHKLPALLDQGIQDGMLELSKTAEGVRHIHTVGGGEVAAQEKYKRALLKVLRDATLSLNAYVTSFCYTKTQDANDGLLSQWRGYGHDGGYAVVFDTEGLEDLLEQEEKNFLYSFGHWGNVDYHDHGAAAHEEMLGWENDVKKIVAKIVGEQGSLSKYAGDFFEPIICLATRHKHAGFREENEVRISVVTPTKDFVEGARNQGATAPEKPIRFFPRNGVLVPYVSLFEQREKGKGKIKLPIQQIVVGPHPEKFKRQKSVERLLAQYEIEAKVIVSSIPFLGH